MPEPASLSASANYTHHRPHSTVLVAVVNNTDDLRRVAAEGWYRIPQRRAPRRIGADYLAFYQTGAFRGEEEAQTVTYYAPTRRYRLLTRRELLPAEPDHPRADDYYFRIEVGPLQRLDNPLPSASLRRITFIHTTLDRLLHSTDIKELFIKEDPFDAFWQTLRANRLRPLANRLASYTVDQQPMDITLRARGGYLGIRWRSQPDDPALQEARVAQSMPGAATTNPVPVAETSTDTRASARINHGHERWEFLTVTPHQVARDMESCLRKIGAALIRLGGSDLNR